MTEAREALYTAADFKMFRALLDIDPTTLVQEMMDGGTTLQDKKKAIIKEWEDSQMDITTKDHC